MKTADIYINDRFCGQLTEGSESFRFQYDPSYLAQPGATALSPTMPLRKEAYELEMMFPVFDGLIPEGWLLDIVSLSWKINPHDRMSLLMECCGDCIGNISVKAHV